jgi:hypothetical protein
MLLKSTYEKKGDLSPRGAKLQECTKYIEVTIVCKKNRIENNKLHNTKFVRKKKRLQSVSSKGTNGKGKGCHLHKKRFPRVQENVSRSYNIIIKSHDKKPTLNKNNLQQKEKKKCY